MGVLILTGPSGAGKNTVADRLVQQRSRCALIDVDLLRLMIVQPHAAPWEGPEGRSQHRLGAQNACALAINFVQIGLDVVILDILVAETARIYRQELDIFNPRIVLLLPTWAEIERRNQARPRLTADEVRLLYDWQQAFTQYDERIDNTDLSPDELAERLAKGLI